MKKLPRNMKRLSKLMPLTQEYVNLIVCGKGIKEGEVRQSCLVYMEVDFTEWALPLGIWWEDTRLNFEFLCFTVTFDWML